MPGEMEAAIYELSLRIKIYRESKRTKTQIDGLTEREMLLLELLSMKKDMRISDIVALYPYRKSEATISMDISRLWKNKLVSKERLFENQRITIVNLTSKGRKTLERIRKPDLDVYEDLADSLDYDPEAEKTALEAVKKSIKYFDEKLGL
jgi:DNA-binding MarR family transcriptional regulator